MQKSRASSVFKEELSEDLLNFASASLVDGGKLVFLVTSSEMGIGYVLAGLAAVTGAMRVLADRMP